MSIEILSSEVVDQIAAGEVVERPAHLIKELVENALDAGSTEVEIEFHSGGRYVRVADNGSGIAPQELPLAFARHATSKIAQFDDLFRLHTFGFRGEALASIGAVSRLTITSRKEDSETAHRMVSEFGQLRDIEPVGGRVGTTVSVDELFANVPARLKFLKAESSETAQIRTMLRALAMSHPGVTFLLKNKSELANIWKACSSRQARVEQVLDNKPMYVAKGELDGLKVEIVFSAPNNTVKNSRQIWTFAQNRWVQDKTMQAAVMEAYRSLLMHGEYPLAAVFLSASPEDVDVNIHPTKSQVKFRESSQVFRVIQRTLRAALEQAPWLTDLLPPQKPASVQQSQPAPQPITTPLRFADPELSRTQYQKREFPYTGVFNQLREQSVREAPAPVEVSSPVPVAPSQPQEPQRESQWSRLEVLGQAHLTYIIAQTEDRMIFVDQHAAHERVAYERLMDAWRNGQIEQQKFLMPLAVDLDEAQMSGVLEIKEDLARLGLEIEQGGPQTVYVSAAPALIRDGAIAKAITELAQEIMDKGGSFALEKTIAHMCATMACHSVVRAGQALSVEQMRELLKQMDEFPLSSFCPHGRPVYVEYPFQRLERDFGRIV